MKLRDTRTIRTTKGSFCSRGQVVDPQRTTISSVAHFLGPQGGFWGKAHSVSIEGPPLLTGPGSESTGLIVHSNTFQEE